MSAHPLTQPLWIALLAITFLIAPATLHAQNEQRVKGKVTDVILYRGQAQITRQVPFDAKVGPMEVVVTDLPYQVEPGSLFAEAGEGLEIRAVRFRNRPVIEANEEAIRVIDKAIQDLSDRINKVQSDTQILRQHLSFLEKLEQSVTQAGSRDDGKPVYSMKELQEMVAFNLSQRQETNEKLLMLSNQMRELQKELNLKQRERNLITSGSHSNVYEAVVYLECRKAGKQSFNLNYLANNCGWAPSYNMRAVTDKGTFEVEYNAVIQQMTGEDWERVKITLSTASPMLNSASPVLAPFFVSLDSGNVTINGIALNAADEMEKLSFAKQQELAEALSRNKAMRRDSNRNALNLSVTDADNSEGWSGQQGAQAPGASYETRVATAYWSANAIANEYQNVELNFDQSVLNKIMQPTGSDDGPSLNYTLENPVSLPSRSDQQMIRIKEADLQGKLYYVATPVLSEFVYREAELVNNTGTDLLRGPVSVSLDGRFVGKTQIQTVARGQTFLVGFGAEPQLRTSRELVKRDEQVQGGNRIVNFHYRLSLENFMDRDVTVRVMDRLPYFEREKDLKITLGEMSDKLSDDKLYLREDRQMGILRWDIELKGGASGEQARDIEYHYTLEHARSLQVFAPTQGAKAAEQQERFNQRYLDRQVK